MPRAAPFALTRRRTSIPHRGASWLLLGALAAPAASQCSPAWTAGDGVPGVSHTVRAMQAWDPDGAGPAAPLLVVAGDLLLADRTPVQHIAAYNPSLGTWQALGTGTNAPVTTLLALPNGNLLAGGAFTAAGGAPANRLAVWDGTSWSAFAGGVDSQVHALCTLPNGNVVAAGNFSSAGGVPANRIARWDGTTWHPLGSGLSHFVLALAGMPNGDVIAGGTFDGHVGRLARWDGTSWSSLGSGLDGEVRALHVRGNGDLLVGGWLYFGGVTTFGFAVWNGATWAPLQDSPWPLHSFAETPSGELFVGGRFGAVLRQSRPSLAHWNGTVWDSMGSGADGNVNRIVAMPNGDVFAGGEFGVVDGVPASRIARWNGTSWSAVGAGPRSQPPTCATLLANGELAVAGRGLLPGVQGTAQVVRWNGQNWVPIGDAPNARLTTMLRRANGDLVVGGLFTSIQGTAANNVARWDGTTWHALGSGLPGDVRDLAELPNGDLVATGSNLGSTVVRWNGTAWSSLGPVTVFPANELLVTADGKVIVASVYGIDRWNNSTWTTLGSPGGSTTQVAELANGDLVAVGDFWMRPGEHVQRFDGTSWQPLATNMDAPATCVHVLPDGDLLVGGNFTTIQGVPARHLARWNGSTWSAVANGLDDAPYKIVPTADGNLLLLGNFTAAGGQVSAFLTTLATPCPATTTTLGAGCAGSGGNHPLTATRPWLGSAWRATASNLPANAFALAFQSFATVTLPLPLVLPQAGPGCTLHVAPQYYEVIPAQQGRAQLSFALPRASALVGTDFHHQMLVFEVASSGAIAAVSTTAALTLTVGAF